MRIHCNLTKLTLRIGKHYPTNRLSRRRLTEDTSICPPLPHAVSHSQFLAVHNWNQKQMMPTRAELLMLATFPGVVVHEWAHKKFCDWFGVKVFKVSYFRIKSIFTNQDEPLGYVVHAEPNSFLHVFLISTGPLIINSGIAIVFSFIANHITGTHTTFGDITRFTFYWLAVSIGAHAFPSNQDARNILQRSQMHIARNASPLHYLSYPFFSFICFANRLRRWWADFLYAAFLVSVGAHL